MKRLESQTECPCYKGWVCEDHPGQPWSHDDCVAAGELCTNPQCDKDADSIFLTVHCRVPPGRRKPPIRKAALPFGLGYMQGNVWDQVQQDDA
jgi:hypothetical protein